MGVDQAPGVRPGRYFERGQNLAKRQRAKPTQTRHPSGGEPGSGTAPAGRGAPDIPGPSWACPGPGGPPWTRRPAAMHRSAGGPRPRGGAYGRGEGGPQAAGAGLRAAGGGAHGRGTFKLVARAPSTRSPLTQPPGDDPPTDTGSSAKPTMPRHLLTRASPALAAAAAATAPGPPPAPWLVRLTQAGTRGPGAAPDAARSGRPPACPTPGPGSPAGSAAQVQGLGGNGEGPQTERDRKGSQGRTLTWSEGDPGPGPGGLDGWAGESGAK